MGAASPSALLVLSPGVLSLSLGRRSVSKATASALEFMGQMKRRDSMALKMVNMFKSPDAHASYLTTSTFALDIIKASRGVNATHSFGSLYPRFFLPSSSDPSPSPSPSPSLDLSAGIISCERGTPLMLNTAPRLVCTACTTRIRSKIRISYVANGKS